MIRFAHVGIWSAGMEAGGLLMTLRRVFAGLAVMCGLSVWAWARPGEEQAHAATADPVILTDSDGEGGNYDDAAHRYRSSQARHWRQVAISHR